MKILAIFISIVLSCPLFAQYFTSETHYLQFGSSADHPGDIQYFHLLQTLLLDTNKNAEEYALSENDYRDMRIYVEGDSILISYEWDSTAKSLLFVRNLDIGDSFFIYPSIEYQYDPDDSISLRLDSVKTEDGQKLSYLTLKDHQSPNRPYWRDNLIWYDSIGTKEYGLTYFDMFEFFESYYNLVAICRNNVPTYIDKKPWEVKGDSTCLFEASLSSVKSRLLKNEESLFSIYPIPSHGKISVGLKNSSFKGSDYSYEVFDGLGHQVYKGIASAQTDIELMNKGMYIVRLYLQDSRLYETHRILIW